jgi:hypothetical protein
MASLPPLADLDDVEDRMGRDITPDEQRKAAAMLVDASATIRAYCRRDFTLNTATGLRLRPRGNKVLLPQRPVVDVASVATVFSFGPTEYVTPTPAWSWVSGNTIYLIDDPDLVFNGPAFNLDDENVWIQVTYTYGYTEVPQDIVSVCANLVLRNLTVPGSGLVDLETVGPYTVRYANFAGGGPLALSGGDRDILNRYRTNTIQTVELRG